MRYRLNHLAMIGFMPLFVLVLVSQAREAGARPCTSTDASNIGTTRRKALVHTHACVREYVFTDGPLYNPMFTYSNSSLSFQIPTMMWSALGKAVFAPATRAKVAPNTTTYWFLHVSDSLPTGRSRGFFASSTSPVAEQGELLEYVVASSQSGIASVRFPMPAQLRPVGSANPSSDQPNAAALTEMVGPAAFGDHFDSSGDASGERHGNLLVAQAAPTVYVVLQTTPAPVSSVYVLPSTQVGSVGLKGVVVVGVGRSEPAFSDGQFAVGSPYTGSLAGEGLTGLFTAGTAGSVPNSGDGMITFGNNTGLDTWTQIGASKKHNINGVHNTVISILEEVAPSAFNQIGCAMDAGANWGCGGGVYGNAAATPFPSPMASVYPTPTTYPSAYGGPAVIAQAASAPTAQPGNVLVGGTLAAVSHNPCAASSGLPCGFLWTISSFSGGIGTTTVMVPVSSSCTITASQTPIVASGDVMTTWVTITLTSLMVHAQDLKGTYSGSFGGYGNCS